MSSNEFQQILELVHQKGYSQINHDDFCQTFRHTSGNHLLRLTHATAVFYVPGSPGLEHVVGASLNRLQILLRKPINLKQPTLNNMSKETKTPKEEKPKAPSARSIIVAGLIAGKPVADIVAELTPLFPHRNATSLKGQIYLHRSEINKGKIKGGPLPAAPVKTEAAPAPAPAPAATPAPAKKGKKKVAPAPETPAPAADATPAESTVDTSESQE